jgi:hypothetical protein
MRSTFAAVLLLFAGTSVSVWAGEKTSLADLPQHAIEESQLTLPGSRPFHLKARVFEKTDLDNDDHNAEIVEDWVSPDKWRRTIKSGQFSEVLVANGGNVTERSEGDYYPNWLRTIVNGIFDPGAALQGINLTQSGDTARMRLSSNGKFEVDAEDGPQVCRRFEILASAPPVTNRVFSTYCFFHGLLQSIGAPGYDLSYANYKKFGGKQVARTLGEYIEPGTELQADIEELTDLPATDDSVFTVQQQSSPLRTVSVDEVTVRGLILSGPDIRWPPMGRGINPGRLSIYVCIDKDGHVRETYSLNSDNPDMAQAAREQVMKWSFKPAVNKGEPVQIESILTFGYQAPASPQQK